MRINNYRLDKANWVHIDLKGTIPSAVKFKEWIKWFAVIGFNGIILEYEDRINWQTWPGIFRNGYSKKEHQEILECCRENGLEIIPLIQTIGHMQWLLKHEEYSRLREDGHISELCPLKPESHKLMIKFIDECIELHPESRFIHLGADEARMLGTCDKCAAKLQDDPRGKLGIYTDHIAPLCRHAVLRGLTPIIWGDMFFNEDNFSRLSDLPAETVFIDWQYSSCGPFENTLKVIEQGCNVLGASAVCANYIEQYYLVQQRIMPRISNVTEWHKCRKKYNIGIIHTCWNRTSSLWPIYGMWYGQIPAYLAAGSPEKWFNHPLRSFFENADRAICNNYDPDLERLSHEAGELAKNYSGFEAESLRWWAASLKYQRLFLTALRVIFGKGCAKIVGNHIGFDQDMLNKHVNVPGREITALLDEWENEARKLWEEWEFSCVDEFLQSRSGNLKNVIKAHIGSKATGNVII